MRLAEGRIGERNNHKLVLKVTKPYFSVRVPSIHGIRSFTVFSMLNYREILHKSPKLTKFHQLNLDLFWPKLNLTLKSDSVTAMEKSYKG